MESDLLIHYLSAERDLVLHRDSRTLGEGLLAMGGADFDAGPTGGSPMPLTSAESIRGQRSDCGEFKVMRFAPLAATAGEVEELDVLWGGSKPTVTLLGSGACESALKAQAPGKRVLHLATHGFFLGEDCGGDNSIKNPLLLSGLALAGANRRDEAQPGEEDGILTAEEISALDLSGVEWAVLSACKTGLGEVEAGEGVLGLRRAFQVAGVGTVIMSLWAVEDEATRSWMQRLYKGRFEDQLSTAKAVRQASVGELQARRQQGESTHPFWWGGFIAAGDWR